MTLDNQTLKILHTVMKDLSHGIDPTSDIPLPNDTILNSAILKKCFSEAADIFDYLEQLVDEINQLSIRKVVQKKQPFYLSQDEYTRIPISDNAISISKFTFNVNSICTRKDMKPLRATQITKWLDKQGYLKLVECEGGIECRSATELGNQLGITAIPKVNSRGKKYIVNVYDSNAQKFIIDVVLPQIAKTVTFLPPI